MIDNKRIEAALDAWFDVFLDDWETMPNADKWRSDMRAALAAADKVHAEGSDPGEIPDDLREPLHSLRADLDWLVARIRTEDDEVSSLCKDSMRTRLSHIEEASYRLAAGLAKGEANGRAHSYFTLRETEGKLRDSLAKGDAERAALREALKPFADVAQKFPPSKEDARPLFAFNGVELTYGDFRKALSLVGKGE